MHIVTMALLATLGTWFVTALGAATVVFFKRPDPSVLSRMLGFAAGVMIAASFWSLLQPAIERAAAVSALPPWLVATAGFLCGAFFMRVSDRFVCAVRGRRHGTNSTRDARMNRIVLLALSVTLHNVPEGLAVGVAFGALQNDRSPEALTGAVCVAVGIGLQNFPEGAAVSVPLRREGCPRIKSFLIGQASGLVEPAAGVIGALTVARAESILPWALSFAAGAMILVAVHELIPACRENETAKPYAATTGVVLGFAVMMLLDVMLG